MTSTTSSRRSATLPAKQSRKAQFKGRVQEDFIYFCKSLWRTCGYEKYHPIQKYDEDMLVWMDGTGSSTNHRGLLAPRGIGKTYEAAALAAYRLNQESEETKALIISKTENHAKATLLLIRGWFQSVSWLRHLMPNRSIGHRDAVANFDVGPCRPRHRTPSVQVRGIDGQLEGCRASVSICDDVETEQNTKSLDMRMQLDKRCKEISRVTTYGRREIVYIGTYHHEDSVYPKLTHRGYMFRTWPALFPRPDQITNENDEYLIVNLAPKITIDIEAERKRPGQKVFPRLKDAWITEQKAEGLSSFEMHQMLMLPIGDARRYPLKLSDLICMDQIDKGSAPWDVRWGTGGRQNDPSAIEDIPTNGFGSDCFRRPAYCDQDRWSPFTGTHMWIDPSGAGANRTGYACVGHLDAKLFVKDLGGLDGGYDPPTLRRLAKIARENRVTRVFVEDLFGQGMLVNLLWPILREHFVGQRILPSAGLLSGPAAWDDQRKHVRDREADRWSCSIEGVQIPKTLYKEERILSMLEPVTQGHRLVIDRRIAAMSRFQIQYTRLRMERDCLDEDDEIDALASCIGTFTDRMNIGEGDLEQERRDDEIALALNELRTVGASMEPASPVWNPHR
jgi:hypothetical protein